MNFNKAIIIGNLTANPDSRKTANGQSVASFSVATNRYWTTPAGEKQEQAEFHSIVTFGRLADLAASMLAKGRLVMVEGRLQTRNWVDQAGAKHWKTEIIAENIQFGPRPGAGGNADGFSQDRSSGYGSRQADNSGYEVQSYNQAEPAAPVSPDEEEIKIEDIPF